MKNHVRPDRKAQRQASAKERQARYNAMTPTEKKAHLVARGCTEASNEFRKEGFS